MRNNLWKIATFIYALCMFTACSSSDNNEEKATQNSVKFVEHHVDTYGVQEVNDGTIIRFTCSTCDQFPNPAKKDAKDLVYLTTTTIREPRNGGNTVIVYNKECFAFYYSTIERDLYYEYKEGYKRQLQKNIKLTIKYIGCTPETPNDKIPRDTETKHISYPDIIGEWMPDILEGEDGGSGSSGTGSDENTSLYDINSVSAIYIVVNDRDTNNGTLKYTTCYVWTRKSNGKKYLSSSKNSLRSKGSVRTNDDTYRGGHYVGGYSYKVTHVQSIGTTFYYYFN